MTSILFIEIFVICSVVTGLLTEVGKKIATNFPNNLIALTIGLVVGIIATAIIYQFQGISYTVNNIICMFLIGLSSSVGAMLGYDKVMQTIKQIISKN